MAEDPVDQDMSDPRHDEISDAEVQRLIAEHRQREWESLSEEEQRQARELAETLRQQGAPDPELAAMT